MKRSILFCLAFSLLAAASLLADDNVRAAQSKLKQDGFYFGEVNGVYDSATAAAVSRYQIRNGLQISGQLNAETAKSLGIAPTAAAAPAPTSGSDTWRRLRKADQQFLANQKASGAAAIDKRTSSPLPAVPPAPGSNAPAENGYQTFTLSRERLRDYVAAFVLAGLDPQVGAELEFFADRVDYYGDGTVGRDKIRADLQRYNHRWPQRQFWLDGEVNVEPQADSRLRVTFPLRFQLQNGAKQSSGRIMKRLLLEVTADDLQIVAVTESKLR